MPNDRQVSGLGLNVPPGTGERWQAVLADAEALLKGEALIPHWRFGAEAGINLKKAFENPPAVDLVTWIQGEGLLPYAEKGRRISADAWNDFERLVSGRRDPVRGVPELTGPRFLRRNRAGAFKGSGPDFSKSPALRPAGPASTVSSVATSLSAISSSSASVALNGGARITVSPAAPSTCPPEG